MLLSYLNLKYSTDESRVRPNESIGNIIFVTHESDFQPVRYKSNNNNYLLKTKKKIIKK